MVSLHQFALFAALRSLRLHVALRRAARRRVRHLRWCGLTCRVRRRVRCARVGLPRLWLCRFVFFVSARQLESRPETPSSFARRLTDPEAQ